MSAAELRSVSLVPRGDRRGEPPRALLWEGGVEGCLRFLDQTRLPRETIELEARTAEEVFAAIHRLAIRGAPAIGLAGAYGLLLGAREARGGSMAELLLHLDEVVAYLASCRPTAVNLAHALRHCARRGHACALEGGDRAQVLRALLDAARALHAEDAACCAAMGRAGAELLRDGDAVLTHCNAGALATGGAGTALAVVYAANAAGKRVRVYADETRPLLQGARLTAWELARAGVPVTLLVDGAAASLLRTGRIAAVFVGADRIAANGDVANKIGTYGVALAAREARVPFYVVAPTTTFDLATRDGASIPIEQRAGAELASLQGISVAADGVELWNPAFDVTPASLVTALISERGVLHAPNEEKLRAQLAEA